MGGRGCGGGNMGGRVRGGGNGGGCTESAGSMTSSDACWGGEFPDVGCAGSRSVEAGLDAVA